jgi:hexosaminidase
LYAWNNVPDGGAEDLPYRLANGGYKVVLAPVTHLYFDLAYTPDPRERGLNWGGYTDLRSAFELDPFDYYRSVRGGFLGSFIDRTTLDGKERLTDQGRRNIVGIQANLWGEMLGADGRLEYMLLPKLLGLAERAWAPEPAWARDPDDPGSADLYQDAWSRFANAVGKRELPRLAREHPGLPYRIPTPGLRRTPEGMVLANLALPGFVLRYTTDGTEPTAASAEVRGPIATNGPVTVAAFDSTGRRGRSAREDR